MSWTDDRLTTVLTQVGEYLDTGRDQLDVAELIESLHGPASPASERSPDRRSHRGLVAAAAMVVLCGVTATVTPARQAVADWLGIGTTRIEIDPNETPLDPADQPNQPDTAATDAHPVTIARAIEVLGGPLPSLPDEDPQAVLVPAEGGVLLVYDRGLTLWVRPRHSSEDSSPDRFVKSASPGKVEVVDNLGERASLISGSHRLSTPGRQLLSESVVLWVTEDRELRLESSPSRDRSDGELVQLARTVRPAG